MFCNGFSVVCLCTLTAGVDAFTGTSGNDSFVADETAAAQISVADSISGGLGNDNFTIVNSKGVLPIMSGIETITLNTIADSVNVDASAIVGLTKLAVIASAGTNNFTVGAGASVSLAGTTIDAGGNGDADINVVFDAAATTATLTLNAIASATANSSLGVTGAKLTTLNIATTGAASTVQELEIGGNAAAKSSNIATLVVTGDKKLTITEGVDLLTAVANTIDTTGLTGDLDLGSGVAALDAKQDLTFKGGNGVNTVTFVDVDVDASVTATFGSGKDAITLTDATGSVSINTGAGDDTLTISELDSKFNATDKETASFDLGAGDDTLVIATALTAANLASGVTLAGGDGTDTLKIYNAEYVKLFDATTDVAVTSIETLNAVDAGTYDVSKVASLTGVTLSGAVAYTLTNLTAAQAQNITFTNDPTTGTAESVALKDATGKADILTLTYAHATADTAIVNDTLTVTGFETVNLVNNNTKGAVTTAFAAGANATALNLTGTGTATNTVNTTNLTALKTFDASGAAGVVALTTAASQAGTFTLSGYADTVALTASTGAATFALGAGKDTLTGAQADIAAATINGGADSDTLVVSDDATTTATLTIADSTFANVTGVEVLDVGSKNIGATAWTLGGYANAIATANAGVLTATATTTGGTDDADGYTLDATGLSVTNAINFTLKDTAVAAGKAAALKVTSGAGADTISVTETLANSKATITIDAGAGDNTVTTSSVIGANKVTTGAGNDTITVTSTEGVAASSVVISAGAGADTISVTTKLAAGADSAVSITAGTGADTITISGVATGVAAAKNYVNVITKEGDTTATAYDTITGYYLGAGSTRKADLLSFDDAAATVAVASNATTDGTNVNTIMSHKIASGVVTFDDVNSYAAALTVTSSNLQDVLTYLGTNTTAGDAVAFTYDAAADGTVDGTFVYANGTTTDMVVYLVGVTGTSVSAVNAATAGLIAIANIA